MTIAPDRGARALLGGLVSAFALLGCDAGPTGPGETPGPDPLTWAPSEIVPVPIDLATETSTGPWSMVSDAEGNVHIVHDVGPREGLPGDMDRIVHLVRSPDGVWSAPRFLQRPEAGGARGPRIGTDGHGVVHAAWYEWDEFLSGHDVIVHRSLAPGEEWSEATELYRSTYELPMLRQHLSVTRDALGQALILAEQGIPFHPMQVLPAPVLPGGAAVPGQNGVPFPRRATYATAIPNPPGPNLAAVFVSPANGRQDAWFARFSGSHWDDPVHLDPDPSRYAYDVKILEDGDGRLHALWWAASSPIGPGKTFHHARSEDGGTTWGTPTDITPALDMSNALWYFSAVTDQAGNPRIFFQQLDVGRAGDVGVFTMFYARGHWSGPTRPFGSGAEAIMATATSADGRVLALWRDSQTRARFSIESP